MYRYGVALMCLYYRVIGEKSVTRGTTPPFPFSAASRQAEYAARLCCVSSRFVLRFLSASSAGSNTKRFPPASVPAVRQEPPQGNSYLKVSSALGQKTDKFRQINRFLEFIEDILPQLDKGRELTILDFGCGKSYLTFAMYYYLKELKGFDIHVIGLDLKEDVIRRCSGLAKKYGYEKLHFLVGDIADYEGVNEVDVVVTLHACDTATDYALAKAIGWNAKVILSVPCCQHEVNGQFAKADKTQCYDGCLDPIMDYGLLRERFAALVTDGLRAKYLEAAGYDTQVLEFIDMEHTPKNILLRAVRADEKRVTKKSAGTAIEKCERFLQIEPTLGRLLADKGENYKE